MALGGACPALLEVSNAGRIAEPPARRSAGAETKSGLGPMACYIGSPLVLVMMGVVFAFTNSFPQAVTSGTDLRRLSETSAPQLASSGCCRFAKEFEDVDWYNPQTRADFLANVMYVESRFLGGSAVAFDPDTGMTYDGVGLDYNTGDVQHETLRTFSAPSKEALHLSLLALALQPIEDVPAEQAAALPLLYSTDEALDILEKKVSSMEDFDARFPGFGGYMPWFCSRGINDAGVCKSTTDPGTSRMMPLPGWERSLPGLDNGQLAFGTAAVVHVLERRAAQEGGSGRFAQMARRWNGRLERMKASVVNLFYDGAGLVRMISQLDNITVDVARNASNAHNQNQMVLWDAFEGEMVVIFMDIFGNWSKYPNNGEEEKKLMWKIKAEHVEPVVYTAADNSKMVLQKGFWFSAHEQWKTLQLPYMDIPLVRHLFTNGEFARLENSLQQQLPGLMASVNAPHGVQCDAHPYCSAVGIQALAEQPIFTETVLTPYASFPSILVDSAAGLAWYNHMLAMPRVQTPVGSIESFTNTGKAVAPMATWDAKATTILAMLGGTGPLLRNYMQEQGVYGVFEDRVKSMYGPVFEPVIAAVMPNKASIDKHIAQLPKLPLPAPHPARRKDALPADFPSCRCLEDKQTPGFLQPKNP
mmetsp:Transcript_75629/g.180717  ORF Transcript_75629/g.180717 Transcript_75629/m.180717 type:complete len:644 (+) Transcript_75629:63-1994(+)